MKQIFKIGTKQFFTYTTYTVSAFFKKNVKVQKYWVVRNVKYIYANNEQEAKEKYKKYFFKEYKRITYVYSDWYSASEGVDFMMNENRINIISTKIVSIDNECFENYDELKENMLAEDFKDWWFCNSKCNQNQKEQEQTK